MSSDLEAERAYPKKDQWAGPSLLKYTVSKRKGGRQHWKGRSHPDLKGLNSILRFWAYMISYRKSTEASVMIQLVI